MPSSTGFEIDNAQNHEGASTIQHREVGPFSRDSDFNTKRRRGHPSNTVDIGSHISPELILRYKPLPLVPT